MDYAEDIERARLKWAVKFNTNHDEHGRFTEGAGGNRIQIHSEHDTKKGAHAAGMAMRRAGKHVYAMRGSHMKQFLGAKNVEDDKHYVFTVHTPPK